MSFFSLTPRAVNLRFAVFEENKLSGGILVEYKDDYTHKEDFAFIDDVRREVAYLWKKAQSGPLERQDGEKKGAVCPVDHRRLGHSTSAPTTPLGSTVVEHNTVTRNRSLSHTRSASANALPEHLQRSRSGSNGSTTEHLNDNGQANENANGTLDLPVLLLPDLKKITKRSQLHGAQLVFLSWHKQKLPLPTGPTPLYLIGNLKDLNPMGPNLTRMSKQYGPVFPVYFGNALKWIISDPAYVTPLLEPRVSRLVGGDFNIILDMMKPIVGEMLVSSSEKSEVWRRQHKELLPVFRHDIVDTKVKVMVAKFLDWCNLLETESENGTVDIEPLPWSSHVIYDLMGVYFMNYDFRSMHEECKVIETAFELQRETIKRFTKRLISVGSLLNKMGERQYIQAIENFGEDMRRIVQIRKDFIDAHPGDPALEHDCLALMLKLYDVSTVARHMEALFLLGFEGLGAALPWIMYFVAKDPNVESKIQQEIHKYFPDDKFPTCLHDLNQLVYIEQVIKETQRIVPPPGTAERIADQEVTLGPYTFPPGSCFFVNLHGIHRNPDYWGLDAEKFNPDHFEAETERNRHPQAWVPFGFGPVACLGREIAMAVMKTFVCVFWKRFRPRVSPQANVTIAQVTATKPKGLFLRLHPRTDIVITRELPSAPDVAHVTQANNQQSPPGRRKIVSNITKSPSIRRSREFIPTFSDKRMLIMYGSDCGTCSNYANSLSKMAASIGFDCTVNFLDAFARDSSIANFPIVIVITSTYNGYPPSNAAEFNEWISSKDAGNTISMAGVSFACFGVGSKSWRTYQQFPRKVYNSMMSFGATELIELGEGDVTENCEDKFNAWAVRLTYLLSSEQSPVPEQASLRHLHNLAVKYLDELPEDANVRDTPNLTARSVRVTAVKPLASKTTQVVHVEVLLNDLQYQAGDHIAICPQNHPDRVRRICQRLNLNPDLYVEAKIVGESSNLRLSSSTNALFDNQIFQVQFILTNLLDLSAPLSRTVITHLRDHATNDQEKQQLLELSALSEEDYHLRITQEFWSVVELLDTYKSVTIGLSELIEYLPKLKPRFYSISSSPKEHPTHAHLTVSVVHQESPRKLAFDGVCSNYLAKCHMDQPLWAFVKRPTSQFFLPDSLSVPIIMVCAGTGIAPFRGFLQERRSRALESPGQKLGPCWLFFGCRNKDDGMLYDEEMDQFLAESILSDFVIAFSRGTKKMYVQHRLYEYKEQMAKLINEGAIVYVCGNASGMAKQVHETFVRVVEECNYLSTEQATKFLGKMELEGRYNEDVWG